MSLDSIPFTNFPLLFTNKFISTKQNKTKTTQTVSRDNHLVRLFLYIFPVTLFFVV